MGELYGESLKTKEWVEEYGLKVFVETGCYQGTALEYAKSLGLTLYSCDINDDFVKECLEKIPEATILAGESLDCLKQILPTVISPTLFWLDSHLPAKYRRPWLFTDENNWPLFEEIKLIKELKVNYQHDVIIMDDIRNIEAPDNPMFAEWGVPNDVIPGTGHSLQEYKDWFADTHTVEFIEKGTGSLVCFPKVKK